MLDISKLSTANLMEECGIQDEKEFRQIIQCNGLKYSQNKIWTKDDCDKIVWRLTRRVIDWYKYKQHDRDAKDGGPLQYKQENKIITAIKDWFHRLGNPKPKRDCIMGIIITGGFLNGDNNGDFILPLSEGINVLIGDRGSGKSTALELCGALSTSTTQATNTLVSSLLTAFRESATNPTRFSRELRDRIKHYDVIRSPCANMT
jgi:hypothetical protein